MRHLIYILMFAACHFLAQFVLFLASWGYVMDRMDADALPTSKEQVVGILCGIVMFPMTYLVIYLPASAAEWGWAVLVVNSLLWGTAIWTILYFAYRRWFRIHA